MRVDAYPPQSKRSLPSRPDHVVDVEQTEAAGRLHLLAIILGDLGLSGFVTAVKGWPVLFITAPLTPWAVSVGPLNFWRRDPVRLIAPIHRVLITAWVIVELLGGRP